MSDTPSQSNGKQDWVVRLDPNRLNAKHRLLAYQEFFFKNVGAPKSSLRLGDLLVDLAMDQLKLLDGGGSLSSIIDRSDECSTKEPPDAQLL